jgi:hypothetical protein
MRTTDIEYRWKDAETFPSETATVCIVNSAEEYYRMSADEDFDARIMYYFMNEQEFLDAFDKDNDCSEFTIIREID